jgi:peptidoglycan/LPS O-acetylase OafA/YrhL
VKDFSKRSPELDGIRGTAILMVLAFHWVQGHSTILLNRVEKLLSFGWTGVDLFFVLSGFLIGGILLDAKDSTNYFRVFYIRRFYRILPLYGVLCLWSIAVFYAPLSTHGWLFQGKVPWYAWLTFGQNFWMAKYLGNGSLQIDSTWSLAVEEQFYLTLPFVIRFVSRKLLPYVLGIGVLLAPVSRIVLWFAVVDHANRGSAAYVLTFCRMDTLLLGVLAACAVRSAVCWDWLVTNKAIISTASVILGAGILVAKHENLVGTFVFGAFGYTWIALFFVFLLLLAVTQQGLVSRLFRFRALTELGIVSYGLYLFHEPMLGLVYGLAGKASPALTGLSAIGLTTLSGLLLFALVRLSWLHFEKPLVKRGHRYQYRYDSSDCKHFL